MHVSLVMISIPRSASGLALIHVNYPRIEGGSITALLKNNGQGQVKRAREELVFHFRITKRYAA